METAELREILERQGISEDVIAGIIAKQDPQGEAKQPAPVPAPEAPTEEASPLPAPEEGERIELKTAMVEFKGKKIMVKMPTLEQVTIIRRLARTFGDAAKEKLTAERAVKLMDRAVKATCSVVARPEDVETVEDLMLEGVTFDALMPLLVAAMEQLRKSNQAPSAQATQGARLEIG